MQASHAYLGFDLPLHAPAVGPLGKDLRCRVGIFCNAMYVAPGTPKLGKTDSKQAGEASACFELSQYAVRRRKNRVW
jgi:hypothetical protein